MRRMECLESLEMCINLVMEAPQPAARTKIRFLVFFLVLEFETLRPLPTLHKLWSLLALMKVPLSWLCLDPTVV